MGKGEGKKPRMYNQFEQVAIVRTLGDFTQDDLAIAFQCSQPAVCRMVRNMERAGLIDVVGFRKRSPFGQQAIVYRFRPAIELPAYLAKFNQQKRA